MNNTPITAHPIFTLLEGTWAGEGRGFLSLETSEVCETSEVFSVMVSSPP